VTTPNDMARRLGCVASQEGEALAERAPFVDLLFGPQTPHRSPFQFGDESERGAFGLRLKRCKLGFR
jgi:tRNA-2-methylthio-N6-dimethylallyladenosine synthase